VSCRRLRAGARQTLRRTTSRRAARGQSMVEYLVIASVAVALLAVPIDGSSSAVDLMLASIKAGYARFLGAISLPQ
jgi:hypothetical protein